MSMLGIDIHVVLTVATFISIAIVMVPYLIVNLNVTRTRIVRDMFHGF